MSNRQRAVAGLATALFVLPITASAMDDIVVTARQKAESLQDTPLSIATVSSEDIQRQGISGIDDIVKLNPSVQFDRSFGPADTRITVRGLSNTRGRSNVAFLVDGVDVTTENQNAAGSGLLVNQRLLSDIERVETLVGPQNALYGRAAFAGAINYITKEPGDIWEGDLRWDVGEFGQKQFDFAAGGPVFGDLFGLRFSSIYWEDDGFYENSISGEPVGDSEGYALALTGVVTPNDFVKIKGRIEYSDEEYGPLPNVRIGGGTRGVNLELREYPLEMLQVGLGTNVGRREDLGGGNLGAIGSGSRFTGTGPFTGSDSNALADFGQYCPPELQDPSRGPGYCLPNTFGSLADIEAGGLAVNHSQDPETGNDYEGTTIENLRLSLRAEFVIDGIGTVTSITGYTDADQTSEYDQDWQASEFLYTNPDPVLQQAGRVTAQQQRSRLNTTQFQQELRFQSDFEGPVNFTLGSLFWDESRDFEDQTFIIFCAPGEIELTTGMPVYRAGYCDGGVPVPNPTGATASATTFREIALQRLPQPFIPWIAETQHFSFYGVLDLELAEDWTLSLENRYVTERFDFQKPSFSSCTNFAGPNPAGAVFEAAGDLRCTADVVLSPNFLIGPFAGPALGTPVGWRPQLGSTNSAFNTPKITLRWLAMDDIQIYGSWARAQKPGGIATTPGGGSPVPIDDDRFDPEKLEAWELGVKTRFDVGGPLQVNGAIFFNDYTDKQIGTQVIGEGGFLSPIIVNASSAEVWGFELNTVWTPDMIEGLTVSAAYTFLDAQYNDFKDDTTSVQRAAAVGGCENIVFKSELFEGGETTDLATGLAALDGFNLANRFGVPNDYDGDGDNVNTNPSVSPFCRLNLAGNQLERTPEHALVLQGNLTRQFFDTGLEWFVELTGQYEDARPLDADNFLWTEEYWIWDARLGLMGDKWDVLLSVENVFEDDTIRGGGSGPDFGAQVSELGFTAGFGVSHYFATLPNPRIVSLRAAYRFGG